MFYFVQKLNEQLSNVNESWKGNKDYFLVKTGWSYFTTTTKYSFRVHDAKMWKIISFFWNLEKCATKKESTWSIQKSSGYIH